QLMGRHIDEGKWLITDTGRCLAMSGGGMLYDNGAANWANTRDFNVAPDETLVVLNRSGLLQDLISSQWQNLGTGFTKFILFAGHWYALGSDGAVYDNGSKSWSNTRDFAFSVDGTLYLLGTDGTLQSRAPGGSLATVDVL